MQEIRYKCIECGTGISRSGARTTGLCRECATRHHSERVKAKWDQYNKENPNYCEYCGKQIPWNSQRKWQGVSACSRRCQAYLMQQRRKESKEALEDRLVSFIKKQGRYTTLAELRDALHISDKLLYARGISMQDINKKAGYVMHYQECTMGKDELEAFILAAIKDNPHRTTRDILKAAGITPRITEAMKLDVSAIRDRAVSAEDRKEAIETRIVNWLRKQPTYCGVKRVIDALNIDYYCTIKKYGIDIAKLNAIAGHYRSSISYFEDVAGLALYEAFTESGIERQKTFGDLKSSKGWRLRFDFYIKSRNALLEVDGMQHRQASYKGWDTPGTLDRDALKTSYCRNNGIRLFRLPTDPSNTFEDRLHDVIQQIKGLPLVTE